MAGQSGSAASKTRRNKEMAGMLKSLKQERERGRCCICYAMISVDRPEASFQHLVFDHIAKHARGADS